MRVSGRSAQKRGLSAGTALFPENSALTSLTLTLSRKRERAAGEARRVAQPSGAALAARASAGFSRFSA
jgi:hypothetical protein